MGNSKRKFLRPKKTSSTFLKFELSSLSGPMLRTRENTIKISLSNSGLKLLAFRNQDVFIQRSDIIQNRLLTGKADLSCQFLPSARCQRANH